MGKNVFYKKLTDCITCCEIFQVQTCRLPQEIQVPPTMELTKLPCLGTTTDMGTSAYIQQTICTHTPKTTQECSGVSPFTQAEVIEKQTLEGVPDFLKLTAHSQCSSMVLGRQ